MNKKHLLLSLLITAFLVVSGLALVFVIKLRQRVGRLEKDKAGLETTIQEYQKQVAGKDSEIASLKESNKTLQEVRRIQVSNDKLAGEAIEALQKVNAATQVGSFLNFNSALVDAQAKVNNVLDALPDGRQKSEISATLDDYKQVQTYWNGWISNRDESSRSFAGSMVRYYTEDARKHIRRALADLKSDNNSEPLKGPP